MADGKKRNGKRICVTGGTGFVGSWTVRRLLEDGYSVNTTVRIYPDRKRDISYLTNLPGASERLQIFNADLDNPESFAAAIQGCIGVFHVAHPLDFEQKETEEVKTKRVTTAILGILQACLDSKTVKRIVYTSSLSTALFSGAESIDDNCWSEIDIVRTSRLFGESYVVTKILVEKLAFEFAGKHGLDLVSVLPTWITGPFICPKVPDTVHIALALIFGDESNYCNLKSASLVHVDDVARAHIHLFEYPNAKGRYLCAGIEVSIEELCEFLSKRYPEYKLPTEDSLNDLDPFKTSGIPSKKLLETGFEFENGLEEIFDGAIKCCKEKGFL